MKSISVVEEYHALKVIQLPRWAWWSHCLWHPSPHWRWWWPAWGRQSSCFSRWGSFRRLEHAATAPPQPAPSSRRASTTTSGVVIARGSSHCCMTPSWAAATQPCATLSFSCISFATVIAPMTLSQRKPVAEHLQQVVLLLQAALHEGTGWQLQPGGVSTFVHVDGGQKLLGHDPFWALVALVLCRQQFGNVEGGNQKAGDHRSRGLLWWGGRGWGGFRWWGGHRWRRPWVVPLLRLHWLQGHLSWLVRELIFCSMSHSVKVFSLKHFNKTITM